MYIVDVVGTSCFDQPGPTERAHSPRVKNEEGLSRVVNQPDPNQNPLACPRTKEAVFICRSREQLISQSKYGARIFTPQQIFLLAFTSHTIRFAST